MSKYQLQKVSKENQDTNSHKSWGQFKQLEQKHLV